MEKIVTSATEKHTKFYIISIPLKQEAWNILYTSSGAAMGKKLNKIKKKPNKIQGSPSVV